MGMGFKLDNINEELVKSLKDIIVYVDVSNWVESGDGTYTNTITVDGISTLSNPVMGVSYLSGTRTTTEDAAYALLLGGTTSTNTIILIASALPSISFNIVLKGCTGAGEITMGNFNELVSKVTSLETSVSSINTDLGSKANGGYIKGIATNSTATVTFSYNSRGLLILGGASSTLCSIIQYHAYSNGVVIKTVGTQGSDLVYTVSGNVLNITNKNTGNGVIVDYISYAGNAPY